MASGSRRKHSSTSNIVRLILRKASDGTAFTGIAYNTSGLRISVICNNEAAGTTYTVGPGIQDITTLGTWADPGANSIRFKEVSATYHPGLYEIQILDSRFSVANAQSMVITVTGVTDLLTVDYEIILEQVDRQDATAFGLSRMDAAITSRSSHSAADVWAVATRVLTAGTNIVLAKGVGVTGFNDLDAAGVRGAVGLAAANLDAQLGDIPTVAEFNARTLASASYFDPANHVVAHVTLVDTVTTNTDMRGTDGANTTAPDNAGIASAAADASTAAAAAVSAAATAAIIDGKVDTLLSRITATLFAGITSLANWLGAMAGKHAPDATAEAEINATGAGSGTFSAASDSQEAIRDAGGGGGGGARQVNVVKRTAFIKGSSS